MKEQLPHPFLMIRLPRIMIFLCRYLPYCHSSHPRGIQNDAAIPQQKWKIKNIVKRMHNPSNCFRSCRPRSPTKRDRIDYNVELPEIAPRIPLNRNSRVPYCWIMTDPVDLTYQKCTAKPMVILLLFLIILLLPITRVTKPLRRTHDQTKVTESEDAKDTFCYICETCT